MSHDDKKKTLRRHLRGMKKQRPRDELKQIKEGKKASGPKGKRKGRTRAPTSWNDDSDDPASADFEKIRSRHVLRGERTHTALDLPPGTLLGEGPDTSIPARLVWIGRDRIRAWVDDTEVPVRLPAELRKQSTLGLAVGDQIRVEWTGDDWLLRSVDERRTTLARQGEGERARILAANVDQAVVVLPAGPVPPKFGLFDRFRIAVQRGGLDAVLCVHKTDLVDAERLEQLRVDVRPYEDEGVDVLFTSAVAGDGLAALRKRLEHRTSVLVGHSGAGKSTLLNTLWGRERARTQEVRDGDGKGRHTTTASTMWPVDAETWLIDTPGIRALALGDLTSEEIQDAFPDLAVHATQCRFRDCRHDAEPGCGVRAAVEDGSLADARYRAYLRLLAAP